MANSLLFSKTGVVNGSDFAITAGVPSSIVGAPPVTIAPHSAYRYTDLDMKVLNAEGDADRKAGILGISPESLKAVALVAGVFTAGFAGTGPAIAKSGASLALNAYTSEKKTRAARRAASAACRPAFGATTR